ncbi:hypothetical protein CR203_08930 [Salipaludibacillus neizhouensis]|uniref:Uncharacterized protein n=1 Tax=Salipaludibacillus neizhouensis TaxID=885475 RepID=A0A3A9K7L2_9BACI|nr:hypothetical protein [Salipaludibacillus neizhouensis]RKL67468.1 hypothetical protein CR203_08930 [Salipaludibacillus neizhouensis]
MATANDPIWIFVLLYAIFIITFISAIKSLNQRKRIILSIGMIVIIPVQYLLQLVSSIGRSPGVTEMQHLINGIAQFDTWAIFVLLAYLYIVIWWIMILKSYKKFGMQNTNSTV